MAENVAVLQRSIVDAYAGDVGLDPSVHYFGGARLRPLPPLDTGSDGLMILGAYPSARFESVGGQHNVPVGDNLGPFEPERYFDGQRVRTQASADELADLFFAPLGIERSSCWVTDLVKVFLFKPGHRAKYEHVGATPPVGYERERFEDLAERSLPWLAKELLVARPRLLVTLGAEVAGILRGVRGQKARNELLGQPMSRLSVGPTEVNAVHLAHPGILMRGSAGGRNPWPEAHTRHLADLKTALVKLGLA